MIKRKNFQLTEHFSYQEMTRSAWAERNKADNTPNALQLAALKNLCEVLLEPLRRQFGPIYINSAFRSEAVNAGVHGVGNSRHLRGEAVDIRVPDIATGRRYFQFIKDNIDVDQLLFERSRAGGAWIHCSVCLDASKNRHQVYPNYRV